MNFYCLLTDDGLPSTETCLCDTCYQFEENKSYAKEMASQSDDTDPDGDFVEHEPDGDEVCCICGS